MIGILCYIANDILGTISIKRKHKWTCNAIENKFKKYQVVFIYFILLRNKHRKKRNIQLYESIIKKKLDIL